MPAKLYKSLLVAITVICLVAVSFVQRGLVRERDELGLTKYTELKGAPPVLALTTVALGGFRGLISNALWMRASDLQDQDKYFEMVQLADWITKLEPHFSQVWLVQAWNMAYNISVKFKDPQDRWRWVERGIELLRDEGLRYNPDEVLMYRELGWFFQHKMGQNLDDAHIYYKQAWANEMATVFGMDKPNWDELLNPRTADASNRVARLENKFKMDPRFMKQVDDQYGPLEWRLPEASAIYWAAEGLERVKKAPRTDSSDLIMLRRVIYQSMQMSFQRGRLIANKATRTFEFGPNLDIIPKANAAYEQAMVDDEKNRDHIETAHRNLLRDIVFYLYSYNREADAINWYKYLTKLYPNKPLIDNVPDSLPRQMSLDDYAIARIQEEINDTGADKGKAVIEGMERRAYMALAVDDDDRYLGLDNLAQKIWERYDEKISTMAETKGRAALPPIREMKQKVLTQLLDNELSPEMAAQLRTKLGLAAPAPVVNTNAPAVLSTNSSTNVPANISTNAPTVPPPEFR